MSAFATLTLLLCVFWVLAGPFLSSWIEKRLEWFVLGMGLLAVSVSWSWSGSVRDWAAAGLLSGVLAAAQLLPGLELAAHSRRSAGVGLAA